MPRYFPKRRNTAAKARPVKLVMQDTFSQQILLATAPQLKDSAQYSSIFIWHSMTRDERQLQRDLNYRCYQLNVTANPTYKHEQVDGQACADPRLQYFSVRNH